MLLYCLTHPIQYQSPMIRYFCNHGVDIKVIYETGAERKSYFDVEFNKEIAWDIDLLGGYPHKSIEPALESWSSAKRFNHHRSQLTELFAAEGCNCVWVHGWSSLFARAALAAARKSSLPVILRGETHLDCVRGGKLRKWAHRLWFSRVFKSIDAFLSIGTRNRKLYEAYGVASEKIFNVPYAVDNERFKQDASRSTSATSELKKQLGITPSQRIVLFVGKLIPKKDPWTLLRAFTSLLSDGAFADCVLIFVGDGELRPELEQMASSMKANVRFVGFQNQSVLPTYYSLSDLFVIPSTFEPWGLVVNEVMNAGKPILASNQIGSATDLIVDGENGFVFPCGDASKLESLLRRTLSDSNWRAKAGLKSIEIVSRWGYSQDLAGLRQALEYVRTVRPV